MQPRTEVKLDFSSISSRFLKHLEDKQNSRILLSAPFGSGKTPGKKNDRCGIVPENSGFIPEVFPKTPEETTQRKEKEIKVNQSKGEERASAEAGSPKNSLEDRRLLFRKKWMRLRRGVRRMECR